MPKPIVWSPLAESDFNSILVYLDKCRNKKIVSEFIDEADNLITQISINPKQYPIIYPLKKIRKCVLTKHNTLYYREHKKQVELLRIYDTRQDPKKLRFA